MEKCRRRWDLADADHLKYRFMQVQLVTSGCMLYQHTRSLGVSGLGMTLHSHAEWLRPRLVVASELLQGLALPACQNVRGLSGVLVIRSASPTRQKIPLAGWGHG